MQTTRLDGRTVIVTGATSGIGFFIAEGLAHLGARIIIAARSDTKVEAAISLLPHPARHSRLALDLSDLESIRAAGSRIGAGEPVDGLVMNAGVISPKQTYTTGPFDVESTVAVNVAAHMELLRLAMPALLQVPSARIVSTGSMLTRKIPFDRSNWLAQRDYRPRAAYAASKHAAEILGLELDRRLVASGSQARSVVSHPGGAIDSLTPDRPPLHRRPALLRAATTVLGPLFSGLVQGKEAAAQPAIASVSAAALPEPAYIGPARGAAGAPVPASPVDSSVDPDNGTWLWNEMERILGRPILAP